MAQSISSIARQDAYRWGAACFFAATGIILIALGFEYIGGYEPCELCLQQRYAYYFGIPVLFIALLFIGLEKYWIATVLFFLISLVFMVNAGLGTYHAGIEWGLWEGPATCGSGGLKPLENSGTGILHSLETSTGPSCGLATWRFLGLSFAGWNVIVCIALTIGCLKAAFASSAKRFNTNRIG